MKIIPAMDLIGGRCVRLEQGDFSRATQYAGDPVEVARRFEDHGLQYLHLVDLDGAREKRIVHYRVLEAIATKTRLRVDFGGGLRSDEDVRIAFECGAAQVTGGSIALHDPERLRAWLALYGSERIILGADSRDRQVAVQGWQQVSRTDVVDFIGEWMAQGITQVICTDISRDGMLTGPSLNLYRDILDTWPVQLIASGGVGSLEDLVRLREAGCAGAIVGKALYENKIDLKTLLKL